MSDARDALQISSGEDDEFVSCDQCQIMFDKNDKSHILSQCLERCHFFCPPCIQELLKTSSDTEKKLECPLCRLSETDKINEQWCFACNVPASIGCYEEYHTVQKYGDLFNARSLQLKQQIDRTNNACDQALKHCQQIQSTQKVILAWMQWLLGEINQWDSSNIATITHLKSLKVEFHVQQEKNLQFTINNINQHIVQLNDRFQEIQAIKGKVSQLLNTYCKNSQNMLNLGSAELMTFFSTSLNQTNQSCINVLKFLTSFLDQGEKGMKELESDQVSNKDKVVMRRTGEFLQKRRLEEDLESIMHLNKKPRKENSDRSEPETNLSRDLLGSSGSNAEFKEAVELHLADINEKRAKLVRELEDTRDKLKISEERITLQAKEAEQNKDLPNRIARLEADLELNAKKVEQANREALNQMERAKAIQQKYEIKSNQHAAVVEQLKTVCEQLVQSKSEVETALRELANQADEMEKLKRDKKLLENRLELEQMDVEKIKEARDKSTIQAVKTNAEFIKTQIKLKEEVRLAKEETEQFKTKLAKVMDKHINELHHLRNYKTTQLEELEIKYKKLVQENGKNCADLATIQAEKIKDQEFFKIKDQEFVKIKDELEKAKQAIEMHNKHFNLPSTKQQQTASVVLNQPLLSTRNVTPTLSPQPIIRLNETERRNVPNAAVSLINKPIKQWAIHNLNAIATDMLADLENKKESDWSEYPCSNCKLSVEMGFYCGECQDFQLCILCHKKDEHHHKMEKFGFDLNRSNSNSKDLQEDRKSRVDRRIISLVHSCNCSDAYCPEPFCRTMKAIVAHNVVCHGKASFGVPRRIPYSQIRCVVCRQLVGLFICHAKHCKDLECNVPYCSNLKKKIHFQFIKNLTEFQNDVSCPKLQSTPPVVKVFPLAVNNVVSHSAPTLIGPVNSAIPSSALAANTYAENSKRVQNHVALLIHAHKCQEGVNQANQSCSTPNCQKMKSLLNHVTACQAGQSCEVPYCSQSKKIISHWSNCCLSDCSYCLGLQTSHDSQSNVVGATAPTVKPFSCVERAPAPSKPIAMPKLQRALVYKLKPITLMGKVRPATPSVIVSHVGTQNKGVTVHQLTHDGNDVVDTSDLMIARARPQLLKIDKGDGKPFQSSVLNPTTSSMHPLPIINLPLSRNAAVGGAIRILNRVIYTVGDKKYLTMRTVADSEKRGSPQQLASSFPQQPPTKKMEHLNLAIALGDGICCPVAALSREHLVRLLLDSDTFGSNFRTTLQKLLVEIRSPNVTKESRQKIGNFFGTHYLFACSFFRKHREKKGL